MTNDVRDYVMAADGVVFSTMWSESLESGSWSTTRAVEEILTDNGTVQTINATWRDPLTSEWNLALAKENYYDAFTLHKYISHPETENRQHSLHPRVFAPGTFI